jgi:hypothetical protein
MSNRDGPRHWLGIYLNDHLASATAGAELARRVVVEELRIQAGAGLFSRG